MVRRKQQHPRALLGPPESRDADRLDVTRPLAPVPASVGSASTVRRSDVLYEKSQVVVSVKNDDADIILLRHLNIDCKELSSMTGANAGPQLSLSMIHEGSVNISWELQDQSSRAVVVCSVSVIPYACCMFVSAPRTNSCILLQGSLLANSVAAAQGFLALLQQNKIAMQLIVAADHSVECGLYLCLHRSSLEAAHASGKQLATLTASILDFARLAIRHCIESATMQMPRTKLSGSGTSSCRLSFSGCCQSTVQSHMSIRIAITSYHSGV